MDQTRWIEFDHFYYEYTGLVDGRRDPNAVEQWRLCRAEIQTPQAGRTIRGTIFESTYDDDDAHHLIFAADKGYLAIRTEVYLPKSVLHFYQARAVALDEPGCPVVWEILEKNELGIWTPIPGQHLRSRTASAEQWLQELGQPLAWLRDNERRLNREREELREMLDPATIENHQDARALHSREIEVRLNAIGRAIKQVGCEVELGNLLVQHLEYHRGHSVTLIESAIAGRNAEMVPIRPLREQMAVKTSTGQRICL